QTCALPISLQRNPRFFGRGSGVSCRAVSSSASPSVLHLGHETLRLDVGVVGGGADHRDDPEDLGGVGIGEVVVSPHVGVRGKIQVVGDFCGPLHVSHLCPGEGPLRDRGGHDQTREVPRGHLGGVESPAAVGGPLLARAPKSPVEQVVDVHQWIFPSAPRVPERLTTRWECSRLYSSMSFLVTYPFFTV